VYDRPRSTSSGQAHSTGSGQAPRGGEAGEGTAAEEFDEFFQAYEQRIFNLVYRLVGDYEDATDLTSDTFVRALRAYDKFRREAQPYTWLYRIALNLCKNYFRQQQHRSRVHAFSLDSPVRQAQGRPTEQEGEPVARELEDRGQAPQERVEAKELEAQVTKCLLALRAEFRTLIVLRDVQGLSYQEIGRIIGCSEKAVKSRLFRARTQLREALGPYLTR
jgi:RNA polymerase sigma-70 factor (ECF subfamily)